MAKFFLFGKYSVDALRGISANRTKDATAAIEKLGGKVISIDVLLGDKDIAIKADFSDSKAAMKASIAITKLSGIGFSTAEAIPVDEFDKMMG